MIHAHFVAVLVRESNASTTADCESGNVQESASFNHHRYAADITSANYKVNEVCRILVAQLLTSSIPILWISLLQRPVSTKSTSSLCTSLMRWTTSLFAYA